MNLGAVFFWLADAPGGVSGEPDRGRFGLAGLFVRTFVHATEDREGQHG